MEAFTYKGISSGKYVEGEIEALNQEESSHKLKEQKIIITNLIRSKKKKGQEIGKGKKGGGFSLFGKKKVKYHTMATQAIMIGIPTVTYHFLMRKVTPSRLFLLIIQEEGSLSSFSSTREQEYLEVYQKDIKQVE